MENHFIKELILYNSTYIKFKIIYKYRCIDTYTLIPYMHKDTQTHRHTKLQKTKQNKEMIHMTFRIMTTFVKKGGEYIMGTITKMNTGT